MFLRSIACTGMVVVLFPGLFRAPDLSDCDLKTVVPAFYCEEDDEVLVKKDLVSDVVYYFCKECEVTSKEAGACEFCDSPMVRKTSGKEVCPSCYRKPEPCEGCEKAYFECPDCGDRSLKEGHCEDCDVDLEKQLSRALVQYECPECGMTALKAGSCTEDDCEAVGKPLVRRCSQSGSFPHQAVRAR